MSRDGRAKPGRAALRDAGAEPAGKRGHKTGRLQAQPGPARDGDRFGLTPPDAHEWVSFDDPAEQRTWRFDVTFLLSHWGCIYGRGCQGVLTGVAPEMEQGCCSYGAHFTSADDLARVKAAARTLTPDQWQFAGHGQRGISRRNADGVPVTRMVEAACIFLNRPGFAGGAGCALHRAALERGEEPMDLKPDVCWQLPLRREDASNPDGSVTSTVGQWDRSHWGAGGDEFAWWCTEAPEAFTGASPVWRSMQAELRALVGKDVFNLLAPYLEAREGTRALLPHPSVRTRA